MKASDITAVIVLTLGVGLAIDQVVMPALERREARQADDVERVQTTTRIPRVQAVAPVRDAPDPILSNAATLRRENDGHYWAMADVSGTGVKFMVDTGASTVALTFHDAQRMGLNPDTLDYRWKIGTAGGEVLGASVLLKSIKVGRVEVKNVEAMVLRDGLSQSLLGMTFLGELKSYEFRKHTLLLRQ